MIRSLLVYLFFACFVPNKVLEASVPGQAVECPTYDTFSDDIANGGMNLKAANYASTCSAALIANSKVVGAALQAQMEHLNKSVGEAQSTSFTAEKARLASAIQTLTVQVVNMSYNEDNIADYIKAMAVPPDGVDDDFPCFNDPHDQIQAILTDLDNQTRVSMGARQAALTLYKAVAANDTNLSALTAALEALDLLVAPE